MFFLKKNMINNLACSDVKQKPLRFHKALHSLPLPNLMIRHSIKSAGREVSKLGENRK